MHECDLLLPISALSHLQFCERRCALIHIEQAWEENRFTAEGRILHEKVHELGDEMRAGVKIARALQLRSFRLGLSGIADVVEFHRDKDKGTWQPFPVEYKRGKPKAESCDTVQICAQAMCLEEMLEVEVPSGALFYGKTRRRLDVAFDNELRALTIETAERLHKLINSGKTPPARYDERCEHCSLNDICMPKALWRGKDVAKYIKKMSQEEEAM
jgi:CRISPR-associated exonuclease Cas4